MKRSIEIEYIEGDKVAETISHRLLVTSEGIMIKDSGGNESYHCWKSFVREYAYLLTLKDKAESIRYIVEDYNSR